MNGITTALALVLYSLALAIFAALPITAQAQDSPQDTTWSEVGSFQFDLFTSLLRCQGMTTDHEGRFWFSANQNLSRADSWTGATQERNDEPFSDYLRANGANHIGDIEYLHGKIYAPIEDGPRYHHPFVAIYNAADMILERIIPLPQIMQPDGVPWLTIDPERGYLITSQYHHTTQINLYDLESGALRKQIPMSARLESIQGGKYLKDHVYMTANDPAGGYALYDLDIWTGSVEKLFHLNDLVTEVEGLSVDSNGDRDGLEFYILAANGNGLSRRIVLYHWKKR